MPKGVRVAAGLGLVVLAVAWAAFSFLEARKEIEILCSVLGEGTTRDEVVRVLETGEYLRYEEVAGAGSRTILVDSPYDLGTSRCVLELREAVVVASRFER